MRPPTLLDTSPATFTGELALEPNDVRRLAILGGQFGRHIKQIEQAYKIQIHNRGNNFSLHGAADAVQAASNVLKQLYADTLDGNEIAPDDVHLAIQENNNMTSAASDVDKAIETASIIRTKKTTVKPRGENQHKYVLQVRVHDINFGVGPAGTGKTWLAVACAVEALLKEEIERILLVRPAVEAGEKLGFLPGDLSQKVDPYLRPLYDALYEMLGFESVGKLIERNIIEIAPLAYMRGRTLNNAFVILDEAQNTTREQMKMFLTRIGFGTTAVVTGDITQVDLKRSQQSGLRQAMEILSDVRGITFTHFTPQDVVRHPLVQKIVEAYESRDVGVNGPHDARR